MSKLFLMVGCPGSGKSTWLKENVIDKMEDVQVISRDEIRFSKLKDGEDYFAHETAVWHDYLMSAKEGLKNHRGIFLDATHISKNSRAKILNALGSDLKNVEINCIYFKAPLYLCLNRNDLRTGRAFVPKSQLRRIYEQLEIPSLEEGFDNIYIYNAEENKMEKIISKEN